MGNDCPLDRISFTDPTGPHDQLNAFGLHIAYDTYRTELTSHADAVHGGESVCGRRPDAGWLPPATTNRNPSTAGFVYSPDGQDLGAFDRRPAAYGGVGVTSLTIVTTTSERTLNTFLPSVVMKSTKSPLTEYSSAVTLRSLRGGVFGAVYSTV
jgi:hypothetical protein